MLEKVLKHPISFEEKHLGIDKKAELEMLESLNLKTVDECIEKTVPANIGLGSELAIGEAETEREALNNLKQNIDLNKLFTNFIGQGYYGTYTPSVILRNIFENPGWYSQYTPYQAEISQGRLESLLNFQTMICELTGLPMSNASLLDEATAICEAISMAINSYAFAGPRRKVLIDENIFIQSRSVIESRFSHLAVEIKFSVLSAAIIDSQYAAIVIQYPNKYGLCQDIEEVINFAKINQIKIILVADLLSLTLLKSPKELGADIACGTCQRFGIPLGFGGPHPAYISCIDELKRLLPGRIIGLSKDAQGNPAFRLALQTREQHIKREKATSNICTAQALLANMSVMYAIYHGPKGLKKIANSIYRNTYFLAEFLKSLNLNLLSSAGQIFDTISFIVASTEKLNALKEICLKNQVNLMFHPNNIVSISLDETTSYSDLEKLCKIFNVWTNSAKSLKEIPFNEQPYIKENWQRKTQFLTQKTFNYYHNETKLMRYIKHLENKDLSLVHSMISLGSCTMKLNSATELIPLSWEKINGIHPFAPIDQIEGYLKILNELKFALSTITGLPGCSLQPNSGAQGEYAGLLTMKLYMESKQMPERNIILIPISAHGTNPASAIVAGLVPVIIKCLENGHIDFVDLKQKASQFKDNLLGIMITYPSTYGVFDEEIKEICELVHQFGGLVYLDGANMNAQVGLTSPAKIGADVCHLNLHKTFAIPHGGGGPGMGPICVKDFLIPFLPGHSYLDKKKGAVSAAPYGSASILIISYLYIKMLGTGGLKNATKFAILNANYMRNKLAEKFTILYTNKNGYCAHEFILDLRNFKKSAGIEAEDIAKRLMDYGFHAPTLSFPVPGTIMIEPTESEDKEEIDRFCQALLSIHDEISLIINNDWDKTNNPIKNSPHSLSLVTGEVWNFPYSRETAAYPLPYLKLKKFWPTVGRLDNVYGDRNLICTCSDLETYI